MRTLPVLALALLWWGGTHAEPPVAPDPHLTWRDDRGQILWSTPLVVNVDGDSRPTPLEIGQRRSLLPPLDLDPLEGEATHTSDFAGKVLVLDFWASGCGPCAESLPWLQTFHEATKERGFEVLTVNMQEPDDVARQFLWALNVRLPVVRYTPAMHEALDIETLPTVMVVDRSGRIRARIDGYKPGVSEQVARLVDELLEDQPARIQPLAAVLEGEGRLEALWAGPLPATLEGLTVVQGDDGPIVLAAANQEVFGFSADGRAQLRKRVGPGAERLHATADATDGPLVFGYRTVGTHVVRIPLGEAPVERLDTGTHVLDLSFQPAAGERPAQLLLATVDGLARMGLDGEINERRERPDPVWQISTGEATVALEEGGRLIWLDGDLDVTREIEVGSTDRILVRADHTAGAGLAPAVVEAAVAAPFLDGGRDQIAVAVAGGLLLLDAESGRALWRAVWPGIADLAAADLDGDGRFELLVGSGSRIVALGAGSGTPMQ